MVGAERKEMAEKDTRLKNIESKILKLCEVFPDDVLTKEWLARMQGYAGSVLRLEAAEEGRFIRLSLSSSVSIYTEEEVREIFTPDASRYVYLLCKEIVRETDKLNNYCGCRIEMESLPDAGCRIGFTVPKYE